MSLIQTTQHYYKNNTTCWACLFANMGISGWILELCVLFFVFVYLVVAVVFRCYRAVRLFSSIKCFFLFFFSLKIYIEHSYTCNKQSYWITNTKDDVCMTFSEETFGISVWPSFFVCLFCFVCLFVCFLVLFFGLRTLIWQPSRHLKTTYRSTNIKTKKAKTLFFYII